MVITGRFRLIENYNYGIINYKLKIRRALLPRLRSYMECLLENAKRCFCQDLYATKLSGIRIDEVKPNYAKCSMPITPDHLNANCCVMGGAIFTLADYAFAIAANSENPVTVTLSSTINFLSPASGSILFAEAKCDKLTKTISFYTTTITDENGKTVAIATSTGFRKHEAAQE